MPFRKLKQLTESLIEAVLPMDISKNKQEMSLKVLLYNVASHNNPEEGFRSVSDLRAQLQFAIANDYIDKDMKGKYYLTKKGNSKLRQLYDGK